MEALIAKGFEHFMQSDPIGFGKNLILLFIAMYQLRRQISPRLDKLEKTLGELTEAVREIKAGFRDGEHRFSDIENRLDRLEKNP